MRTVSFAIIASAALLAGCNNRATLESRHYSNERSTVSIAYSTDLVVGNRDRLPDLDKERAQQESDFLQMGFARTGKIQARPLVCRVEITGDGQSFQRNVNCQKEGAALRRITFEDDAFLSTMLAFIFPDEFKKLVPAG